MDSEAQLAIRELLSDVGWLPSDLKCEEKKRLAEEYLDATVTWLHAAEGPRLKMLEHYKGLRYGALLTAEYEALASASDEARVKAAQARMALQAHIAAHGC